MTRIRAVLFDAFGTLFRPRQPVHVQYANIAQSYGLVVSADEVKGGFRRAFSELSEEHPLYGKHSSPPLQYGDWWSLVIERTFEYADVPSSDLQIALPTLLPALLHRFWSNEGYAVHDDVLKCLEQLNQRELHLGVVSNSDPRIVDVLKSLQITPSYITEDDILTSWNAGVAKPDPRIFLIACDKFGISPAETLVIGDDLQEDVEAAQKAGLRGLLIKRQLTEADYIRKQVASGDLTNVSTVHSLRDVPDWIAKQV